MKQLIAGLLAAVFLISCSDEETLTLSAGDNFMNSQTSVALIDTISVHLSTVKIDSVATSSTTNLLVGSYTDANFGKVTASAYAQLEMPDIVVDKDEILDSIVLQLSYTGTAYGDTLLPQTLQVHRVREEIAPSDEYDANPYLYNTTTFQYDEAPLGVITVVPKPNKHDSLRIRLNDALGQEFWKYLLNENDELNSISDFPDIFEGVTLLPGNENNSLLSFAADTSMQIILYTHLVADTRIEKSYSFRHGSTQNHFNHVDSEVDGTGLEQVLIQRDEVSSSLLNQKSYIQASTGYVTRIDFPGIQKILEVDQKSILYRAELVLRPYPGTYKKGDLPTQITLYIADGKNNILEELTDVDGNSIPGTLTYDEFYNENTFYVFDVTQHIYSELSDGFVDPETGLVAMLSSTDYVSTVNRTVFDARSLEKYRPLLNLYYVFYE